MGCNVHLWDHHGYAPQEYDRTFREEMRIAATELIGEENVRITDAHGGGCSDIGDVSCVMPALHPHIGGAKGTDHGKDYRIEDPVRACVDSAKVQCAILARLLEKDAAGAKKVLANARKDYPTIPEYLAMIDSLCIDKDAVTYREDGTVELSF
jgi:metal-dependent amidase/aminoacylase/carboxypeptidase family protein